MPPSRRRTTTGSGFITTQPITQPITLPISHLLQTERAYRSPKPYIASSASTSAASSRASSVSPPPTAPLGLGGKKAVATGLMTTSSPPEGVFVKGHKRVRSKKLQVKMANNPFARTTGFEENVAAQILLELRYVSSHKVRRDLRQLTSLGLGRTAKRRWCTDFHVCEECHPNRPRLCEHSCGQDASAIMI